MPEMPLVKDYTEETIEIAMVIKTICDKYDINTDDLTCTTPCHSILNDAPRKISVKKRFPVKFPISHEIAPISQKDKLFPYLSLWRSRSIDNSVYSTDNTTFGLELGIAEFELQGLERPIRLWLWMGNQESNLLGPRYLYFLEKRDYFHFARTLKRWIKNKLTKIDPPILPTGTLAEIYNNSIGFLLKGREMRDLYKRYNIPYKRGILLCGKPGSGKTLTCKWLRHLCTRNNLDHKVVSMEDYHAAIRRESVSSLFRFQSRRSGIIFFDDMDVMVKDRKSSGDASSLSTFLSEMDGLDPADGVIFMFTTNHIKELDEAFVRPGRIDLWITFDLPTEKMRTQFVENKFDKEIKNGISISALIDQTNEYSFAELEEVRKLFCMSLIDNKDIDLEKTLTLFTKHRKEFEQRLIQGFSTLKEDKPEPYQPDWEGFPHNY